MPKKISDLQKASGLGINAVREAVKRGELPGYQVGRRFVITDEVFDDWLHGRWVPQPRPQVIRPVTPHAEEERVMIHKREGSL